MASMARLSTGGSHHGVSLRHLLPGNSAVFLTHMSKSAVITEGLICTICFERVPPALLCGRFTITQPDHTRCKIPTASVCFWSARYHRGWITYVGKLGDTVAVASGGEFLRNSVYHMCYAKSKPIEPPEPLETLFDSAAVHKSGTATACAGNWYSCVIRSVVGDPDEPIADEMLKERLG